MRKPTLDDLTNLAIIGTCVVFVTALSTRQLPRQTPPAPLTTFAAGKPGPALKAINYGDRERTLVMFLSSSCRYCTESVSFYRTLTRVGKDGGRLRFVVASMDSVDGSRAYLRGHDIEVDAIVTTTSLVATPTLVLVDRSGVVQHVWVGKQDAGGERSVLEAVSQASTQARSNVQPG